MEKQDGRLYGLDILRIISMLLITVIHFCAYSLIMFDKNITTTNHVFMSLMYAMTVVAVNAFVMITGYFQCDKKVNYKRIFVLWFDVITVSLLLFGIMLIINKGQFAPMQLIKSVFPVLTGHWWFLSAYIILCLASPLLNILIKSFSQKSHFTVCIFGCLILSVFYVSNPFITSTTYIGSSRGMIWFFYLYILAAYFKKYPLEIKRVWLMLTGFICYALLTGLIYLNKLQILQAELTANNSVLVFILTVCVFLLFKSIKIKSVPTKSVISLLSVSSFFVYIVQEHEMVRYWYWGLFDISNHVRDWYLPLILMVSVLILWPIAFLLGKLLKLLDPIKNLLYNKLFNFAGRISLRFSGGKTEEK